MNCWEIIRLLKKCAFDKFLAIYITSFLLA